MKKKLEVQETAFVISIFRASNEQLSKDIFAKMWHNSQSEILSKNLINNVSKYEPITHCLRNRYFYETIKGLIEKNKIEVLINFGCGFSMYPFLLDKNLTYIEIDKPDVIEHKKEIVKIRQSENVLPERNIHFISSDFESGYETKLLTEILKIKKDKPSFILLEGVLFFLTKQEAKITFNLFNNIQAKGDFIGSVSYQKKMEYSPAFKKLLALFKRNLTLGQHFNYLTLSDDFYHDQKNYSLVDYQNYYSLSKVFSPKNAIDPQEDILNESMYLLQKMK